MVYLKELPREEQFQASGGLNPSLWEEHGLRTQIDIAIITREGLE